MNKQTEMAIAYTENFLSFLFLNKDMAKEINAVYLFGSAVRGELEKESDIDIFIDTKNPAIEAVVKKSISVFLQSKDYEKWKLLHFIYPLSIQVGILETWELRTSIDAEGVLVYSKNITGTSAKRQVLFVVTLPKKKTAYLKFIRSFFGRNETGYLDKGILGAVNGKKLSSTVFIVEKEYHQQIEQELQKEKIVYTFKEIALFA